MRIGFVGLGAEVLAEIGMSIKEASPCQHTFVITHCNGAASYIAPEHLHIEGGYEIRSSPFAPQAAEMAVKQAVKKVAQYDELKDRVCICTFSQFINNIPHYLDQEKEHEQAS